MRIYSVSIVCKFMTINTEVEDIDEDLQIDDVIETARDTLLNEYGIVVESLDVDDVVVLELSR